MRPWYSSMPATLNLQPADLVCPPGDAGRAEAIRLMLQEKLDDLTALGSAEFTAERAWLRRQVWLWTRRVKAPSEWFRVRGADYSQSKGALSKEYLEDRAVYRAGQVVARYERAARVVL